MKIIKCFRIFILVCFIFILIPWMTATAAEPVINVKIDDASITDVGVLTIEKEMNVTFKTIEKNDSVVDCYLESERGTIIDITPEDSDTTTVRLVPGQYYVTINSWIEDTSYYSVNVSFEDASAGEFNIYDDNAVEGDTQNNTDKTSETEGNNETVVDKTTKAIAFDLAGMKTSAKEINGEKYSSIKVGEGDYVVLDLMYKDDEGSSIDTSKAKFEFSDKSIMKVDDQSIGVFKSLKSGECVITATYKGLSTKLYVDVYDVKYSFKKSKYTIKYGKTAKVKIIRNDGKDVDDPIKVTSSNKGIADYDNDNNVITTRNEGTCTLTFTMVNNQNITCTVTVPELTLLEKLDTQVAYTGDLSQTYTEKDNYGIDYTYASVFIGNRKKTTKNITYAEFSVYQYDNKGTRINSDNSEFNCNDTIYGGSFLKVYMPSNIKKYHSCIRKIYYDDGRTWTNPLYDDWAKKYKNIY